MDDLEVLLYVEKLGDDTTYGDIVRVIREEEGFTNDTFQAKFDKSFSGVLADLVNSDLLSRRYISGGNRYSLTPKAKKVITQSLG